MSGKILGHGTCKKCGEPIRWTKTAKGNFMPIQANDNEPHFPHCGKGSWSLDDWADYLIETGKKIKEKNKRPAITGRTRKSFYDGERPPWDYPGEFIDCCDTKAIARQVRARMAADHQPN